MYFICEKSEVHLQNFQGSLETLEQSVFSPIYGTSGATFAPDSSSINNVLQAFGSAKEEVYYQTIY